MTGQWPGERRAKERRVARDKNFKTRHDFLDLLNALSVKKSAALEDVVSLILEEDGDFCELEVRASQYSETISPGIPDRTPLLMTLACARALAKSPSLKTWVKVNALKCDSWHIAHWLSVAMEAYAEVSLHARNAYISIAKTAFVSLDDFSLMSKFERTNSERSSPFVYWSKCKDKLDEIWWGLRGWNGFMNYEEEIPLFQVFYRLAPDEFIRTISVSSNPYLVSALLSVAGIGGVSPAFSDWKKMVIAAPGAFEDGGRWNGSVLIPLLLVDARSQLVRIREFTRSSREFAEDVVDLNKEINEIATLVASTLSQRTDSANIFARWSSWLMRQFLIEDRKSSIDIGSLVSADEALLEAIGAELGVKAIPHISPGDAPSWEAWCYRCVTSYLAYNEGTAAPDWRDFEDEWNLSPEDWDGAKGRLLRERASLIATLSKEPPGLAANLLAYPIAQSTSAANTWGVLWANAFTLREIVEFGDADAGTDEYVSRSDAGRLLLLLFRIGLAIFDQGAARSFDRDGAAARNLAGLFSVLHSAASEMRQIDSTLNHDEWLVIAQHLAVRRLIWARDSDGLGGTNNFQVFKNGDVPTVAEILSEEKGNVVEFVAILQSLLLNSAEASQLKEELKSASIDLSDILSSIRSLNKFHPNKYPIDEDQLGKLEAAI